MDLVFAFSLLAAFLVFPVVAAVTALNSIFFFSLVSFAIGYFLHTLPEFPLSWQQHFVQVYILPVHEILQSPQGRTMSSCDTFCRGDEATSHS